MKTNESTLHKFIMKSKDLISKDGYKEVMHYYSHDEFEIALEGLILELIIIGYLPEGIDPLELENLLLSYNLKDKPTLDDHLWSKFQLLKTDRR